MTEIQWKELAEYKVWIKTLQTGHLLYQRRYNFYQYDEDEIALERAKASAVYAELDTREHVPNAREKLSLRQARGRQKRNGGKQRKQN